MLLFVQQKHWCLEMLLLRHKYNQCWYITCTSMTSQFSLGSLWDILIYQKCNVTIPLTVEPSWFLPCLDRLIWFPVQTDQLGSLTQHQKIMFGQKHQPGYQHNVVSWLSTSIFHPQMICPPNFSQICEFIFTYFANKQRWMDNLLPTLLYPE